MKTLYLLRHAKAERESESGEDFDRPLAERGFRDAKSLGRFLSARDWRPDLIITSSARRTLETVDRMTADWPRPVAIVEKKELYLATSARLLASVRAAPDSAASLMLVGHNPGIEDLAIQLTGNVASEAARRMNRNFPTCGLAVFELSVERWARVSPDFARLVAYYGPKDLADDALA